MRIKLDENLPEDLQIALSSLGHDTDTVISEGLAGRADAEVLSIAKSEGRFLITQDLDFSDIRRFAPGSHPGIMLVRLRSPSRVKLLRRIEGAFAANDTEFWSQCFILLTDSKLRIRRPES